MPAEPRITGAHRPDNRLLSATFHLAVFSVSFVMILIFGGYVPHREAAAEEVVRETASVIASLANCAALALPETQKTMSTFPARIGEVATSVGGKASWGFPVRGALGAGAHRLRAKLNLVGTHGDVHGTVRAVDLGGDATKETVFARQDFRALLRGGPPHAVAIPVDLRFALDRERSVVLIFDLEGGETFQGEFVVSSVMLHHDER